MVPEQPSVEPPGPKQSAADLLPEIYAELRRLAAALSGRLQPGQTLQPTALVHEAYLRLVRNHDPGWEGRRHFFGAAVRPQDSRFSVIYGRDLYLRRYGSPEGRRGLRYPATKSSPLYSQP